MVATVGSLEHEIVREVVAGGEAGVGSAAVNTVVVLVAQAGNEEQPVNGLPLRLGVEVVDGGVEALGDFEDFRIAQADGGLTLLGRAGQLQFDVAREVLGIGAAADGQGVGGLPFDGVADGEEIDVEVEVEPFAERKPLLLRLILELELVGDVGCEFGVEPSNGALEGGRDFDATAEVGRDVALVLLDKVEEVVGPVDEERRGVVGAGIPAHLALPVVVTRRGGEAEAQRLRQGIEEEVDVGATCADLEVDVFADGALEVEARVDKAHVGVTAEPLEPFRLGPHVDNAARHAAILGREGAGVEVDRGEELAREDGAEAAEVVDGEQLHAVDEEGGVFGCRAADDDLAAVEGRAGDAGEVLYHLDGVVVVAGDALDFPHGEDTTRDLFRRRLARGAGHEAFAGALDVEGGLGELGRLDLFGGGVEPEAWLIDLDLPCAGLEPRDGEAALCVGCDLKREPAVGRGLSELDLHTEEGVADAAHKELTLKVHRRGGVAGDRLVALRLFLGELSLNLLLRDDESHLPGHLHGDGNALGVLCILEDGRLELVLGHGRERRGDEAMLVGGDFGGLFDQVPLVVVAEVGGLDGNRVGDSTRLADVDLEDDIGLQASRKGGRREGSLNTG